jgi:signal transduction histidine kinase/ActR/RegA family two-component response regulator
LPDALGCILTVIKRETGIDAIGIRLRDQDDFPYFVQEGFAPNFLLTENSLTVRSAEGWICREPDGKPSLECTCGLVLSGRTDPSHPFFTSAGSFWTNDVTPWLDLPAEQDPRLNPRNQCLHHGYRSVALIPMRVDQEIVGLLQLNSRATGCFTLEMVQFFEGICASVGAALMRKKSEAMQRLDESRLETLMKLAEMTWANLEVIASFALEEAVRLTQSEIGYVAFANEDETVLTMHAWSATAMKQCRTKDKPIRYPVVETGLWGEPIRQRRAVITNDYKAPNPLKKGTPEGHVNVRRHLGVPIFDGKRIVIVAGVGNKTADYTEGDVRQLTLLMGGMWQIIQRQRAEQEQRRLEAQLVQAQKMESIGRLAGGVAHDFNNMLAVILGRVELALDQIDPRDPLHTDLQEIQSAAKRSADLTRQLLGFARKQAVAPVVQDLNETLEGSHKMLQRLLGEEINLAWLPGAGLWLTKIDPAQIDQVLTNLVINARDALCGAGMITIDTTNITLDEVFCSIHPGFVPGQYVQLAVSDNGCGMKKEVIDHLFEPFFTTKGVGQGTGLGLATVYGIIKQNDGFINVYSEPGRGTSFKIFLPRVQGESVSPKVELGREISRSRGETVLLVEDETSILNLGKTLLERLGYTVLTANTPGEALRLAQAYSGKIHLLITDVVMPEMNGHELVQLLSKSFPELKSLFMSGYTADMIARRGILHTGVHFIQKPFSYKDFSTKVQEALRGN